MITVQWQNTDECLTKVWTTVPWLPGPLTVLYNPVFACAVSIYLSYNRLCEGTCGNVSIYLSILNNLNYNSVHAVISLHTVYFSILLHIWVYCHNESVVLDSSANPSMFCRTGSPGLVWNSTDRLHTFYSILVNIVQRTTDSMYLNIRDARSIIQVGCKFAWSARG